MQSACSRRASRTIVAARTANEAVVYVIRGMLRCTVATQTRVVHGFSNPHRKDAVALIQPCSVMEVCLRHPETPRGSVGGSLRWQARTGLWPRRGAR
jgi:hypothetical protein